MWNDGQWDIREGPEGLKEWSVVCEAASAGRSPLSSGEASDTGETVRKPLVCTKHDPCQAARTGEGTAGLITQPGLPQPAGIYSDGCTASARREQRMQLFSLAVLGMHSGHRLSTHRGVPPSCSWEWASRDRRECCSHTSYTARGGHWENFNREENLGSIHCKLSQDHGIP